MIVQSRPRDDLPALQQPRPAVNALQTRLELEINPRTVTERLLISEVVRRAERLDSVDSALRALEFHSEMALGRLLPTGDDEQECQQTNFAAFMSSPRADTLARQSLANGRVLVGAIRQLQVLSSARQAEISNTAWLPDTRFRDEAGCCSYLVHRYDNGIVGCRSCGALREGSWIAVRRCWQCARCRAQTCVRSGTVMRRSHLPLVIWFQAIRILLMHPRADATELGNYLQLHRAATVRSLKNRINAAIASENASQLLASLDEAYLTC